MKIFFHFIAILSWGLIFAGGCAHTRAVPKEWPIRIEVLGGGILGGINPTRLAQTLIQSDSTSDLAEILWVHETQLTEKKEKRQIRSRKSLEELLKRIRGLGFFELSQTEYHLTQSSRPYPGVEPLLLTISTGDQSKSVRALPPYPRELELSLKEIQKWVSNREP